MKTRPHRLPDDCPKCGSSQFVDTEIHDGESLRRDCARCHRTAGFIFWHGEPVPSEHVATEATETERLERVERLLSDVPRVRTAATMFTEQACRATSLAATGGFQQLDISTE